MNQDFQKQRNDIETNTTASCCSFNTHKSRSGKVIMTMIVPTIHTSCHRRRRRRRRRRHRRRRVCGYR